MSADRSNYRVQVSRMMSLPSQITCSFSAGTSVTSVPEGRTHSYSSSCVTANASLLSVHSIVYGANSSLPAPRHQLLRTIKLRLVLACLEISLQ
jgi:hypothetical protein